MSCLGEILVIDITCLGEIFGPVLSSNLLVMLREISTTPNLFFSPLQRQAERIKREKAQSRRGDDIDPQVQPEAIVPVSRFHGSRLASGPSPSPYQDGQSTGPNSKHSRESNGKGSSRPPKVSRSSSASTVGAAIVEAENSLETDVCFPLS